MNLPRDQLDLDLFVSPVHVYFAGWAMPCLWSCGSHTFSGSCIWHKSTFNTASKETKGRDRFCNYEVAFLSMVLEIQDDRIVQS